MSTPLISVAECAALLRVSPDFVRARIKSGELPALRDVGRGYRIRREALEAFLRAKETASASTPSTRLPVSRPPGRPNTGSTKAYATSSDAVRDLFGSKR